MANYAPGMESRSNQKLRRRLSVQSCLAFLLMRLVCSLQEGLLQPRITFQEAQSAPNGKYLSGLVW